MGGEGEGAGVGDGDIAAEPGAAGVERMADAKVAGTVFLKEGKDPFGTVKGPRGQGVVILAEASHRRRAHVSSSLARWRAVSPEQPKSFLRVAQGWTNARGLEAGR